MTNVSRRSKAAADDAELRMVTDALHTPLPPAPVLADPRVIWAAARHARRLRAEAQISLILTASQIAACAVVVAVVVRFVPWPDAWSPLSFEFDDRTLWYGALGLVMAGTLGLSRLITGDRDRRRASEPRV
jgi:hypothetical protein